MKILKFFWNLAIVIGAVYAIGSCAALIPTDLDDSQKATQPAENNNTERTKGKYETICDKMAIKKLPEIREYLEINPTISTTGGTNFVGVVKVFGVTDWQMLLNGSLPHSYNCILSEEMGSSIELTISGN